MKFENEFVKLKWGKSTLSVKIVKICFAFPLSRYFFLFFVFVFGMSYYINVFGGQIFIVYCVSCNRCRKIWKWRLLFSFEVWTCVLIYFEFLLKKKLTFNKELCLWTMLYVLLDRLNINSTNCSAKRYFQNETKLECIQMKNLCVGSSII